MKIGEQLQQQRQLHQMSQDELADKLHISRQSISKWENGGSLPSFANVVAISSLFKISLDELIRGDEDLMEKLERNDRRISNVKLILIIGIIIAVIVAATVIPFALTDDTVERWSAWVIIISFIGVLVNIRWREFNKSLTKKVIIWGGIYIALQLIPLFNLLFSRIMGMIK